MKRRATAIWKGAGLEGSGNLTTHSKALNQQPYSTKIRFEDEEGKKGTNPEELIAAAHSGCFTMALGVELEKAGFTSNEMKTDAVLTLSQIEDGWEISKIELDLSADIPDITDDKFQELAAAAKEGCPVSNVLNCDIELNATLK